MFKYVARDGTPCRYCGAVFAHPHDNPYGACLRCWDNLSDDEQDIDDAGTVLAIRALTIGAKRFARGVDQARPCECITGPGGYHGYQCTMNGLLKVDGRLTCHAHARQADRIYVDEVCESGDEIEPLVQRMVMLVHRVLTPSQIAEMCTVLTHLR